MGLVQCGQYILASSERGKNKTIKCTDLEEVLSCVEVCERSTGGAEVNKILFVNRNGGPRREAMAKKPISLQLKA